jgi:hypothetical protein
MRRYTPEMTKKQYDEWCRGEIGAHTMCQTKYNAFKKRMNWNGLKKTAENYKVSQKMPKEQYLAARKAYQRSWREEKKRRMAAESM